MRGPLARRVAIALIALTPVLAACGPTPAPLADRGIGGTGATAEERGLGGTGATAEERGIGGTGILGTITGFGSIIVNGIEVDLGPETQIGVDTASAGPAHLELGQLVSVVAEGGQHLVARSVAIRYAVIGPVDAAQSAGTPLRVLGQRVVAMPKGLLPSLQVPDLAAFHRGEWVAVSGLRNDAGEIVATRIETRPAGSTAVVEGRVARTGANRIAISGAAIRLPADCPVPQVGQEMRATGRVVSGILQAGCLVPEPPVALNGVARLSLEGYVTAASPSGRIAIDGFDVLAPLGSVINVGARLRLEAAITAQGLSARLFRVFVPGAGYARPAPAPGGRRQDEPAMPRAMPMAMPDRLPDLPSEDSGLRMPRGMGPR